MGKHAANTQSATLYPVGRSRSITGPGRGPKEVTALIGPSCRWRGEPYERIPSESSQRPLVHYFFSFRSQTHRPQTCTSQFLPARIDPHFTFHISFRLSSHYIDLDRDHPYLSYEPSIAVEFLKFQITFLVARSCQRAKLNIYLEGK